MTPLLVIPAAGTSSRMRGRDKLLEQIDNVPLLRRQALAALAVFDEVHILLRPGAAARSEIVSDLKLTVHYVPDADEGFGATMRFAARLPTSGQALGVLLPDVPGIGPAEVQRVKDVFAEGGGQTITRASDPMGRPGTPILFPANFVHRLKTLTGDQGGRSLIAEEAVNPVAFEDDRATLDLDSPEDWEDWRRSNRAR